MLDARLVVVGGEADAREIRLKLPSTFGRGRDATITLGHPLVSRQHCELYEQNGMLMVRDLGSLNGTFVGNRRVTEAELPPGELLTVGAVTFRAVYGEMPELFQADRASKARDTAAERSEERTVSAPPGPARVDAQEAEDVEFVEFLDDDEAVEAEDWGEVAAEAEPSASKSDDQISEIVEFGDAEAEIVGDKAASAEPAGRSDLDTVPAPKPAKPSGAPGPAIRLDLEVDKPDVVKSDDEDLTSFLKNLGR